MGPGPLSTKFQATSELGKTVEKCFEKCFVDIRMGYHVCIYGDFILFLSKKKTVFGPIHLYDSATPPVIRMES